MSNLKPCPFCGEKVVLTTADRLVFGWSVWHINPDCGIEWKDYPTKDKAIAAWNRRTPIDLDQVMRDNINTHNIKLRDEQLTSAYRAGYERKPLSINYTDDEISEYNQGQGDRLRERDEC